jgi:ADP-heptose:LPS heptosyltransferase
MLPALAALRRRYQDAKITVITNCQLWDHRGAKEVLEPSPFKDRLLVLDDHPVQRDRFSFHMDAEKFKEIECDLFVNLSPFGNRGWFGAVVREMIFAKKLRAEYAVGFSMSTYSRWGIFNRVRYRLIKNEPRRSQEVLRKLGISLIENEDLLSHDIAARASVLKKIKEHGGNAESLFVINPGGKFSVQCWPADRFGIIANYVAEKYHSNVILTGVASERDIAEKIGKEAARSVINLVGETTISELVELLRLARACITNDTGTMHISGMIGIPTVALFTARFSPMHWFPAGKRVISIFSLIDCKFCYEDACQTKECLNAIEVDDVIEALEKVLSEG